MPKQQPSKEQVMQQLAEIGVDASVLKAIILADPADRKIVSDEVRFHDGQYISLPRGVTYGWALSTLEALKKDEETVTGFSQRFPFRPDDVLVAAAHVMTEIWGMTLGKEIHTFFGTTPPSLKQVQTSLTTQVQVPSGLVQIPTLGNAEFNLTATQHPDFGPIGFITAKAPKMYRKAIEHFFAEVSKRLQTHSIYRGKALLGADSMEFQDVQKFDETKIVLADDVFNVFDKAVWGTIRHADALRKEGIPIRRTILLHGEYGTGKTSGAVITAKVAEQFGWTTIIAKPTDDVKDVLKTAALYAPAVVVVEDIDAQANDGDPKEVSNLLDLFDGSAAKNRDVIMILTTNKPENIHKGMLRPGRLDYTVHVGHLDESGVQRLVTAIVGDKLAQDVDWNKVFEAADKYSPAFVRAVCDRSKQWGLVNGGGNATYKIGTAELVDAAVSLQPQLVLLNGAGEGVTRPTLDIALGEVAERAVKDVLEKAQLENDDWGTAQVEFPERVRS